MKGKEQDNYFISEMGYNLKYQYIGYINMQPIYQFLMAEMYAISEGLI